MSVLSTRGCLNKSSSKQLKINEIQKFKGKKNIKGKMIEILTLNNLFSNYSTSNSEYKYTSTIARMGDLSCCLYRDRAGGGAGGALAPHFSKK